MHAAVEWAKEAGALPTYSVQKHYQTLKDLKRAEQGLGTTRAWPSAIAFADRELPRWREVSTSAPVVEDKAQYQVDRAKMYVQWQRQHRRPPINYGGKNSDLTQAQLQERKVAQIFANHRAAFLKAHQGTGASHAKWYPRVATEVYAPAFGPLWFKTSVPKLLI